MNKKAEATLMELLLEIVETNGVFSQTKAILLKKLLREIQDEKEEKMDSDFVWFIVFIVIGAIIGVLVCSVVIGARIDHSIENGFMERKGKSYRLEEIMQGTPYLVFEDKVYKLVDAK